MTNFELQNLRYPSSTYLPTYLPNHPPTHPSSYSPIYLPTSHTHPFIHLSMYPYLSLSILLFMDYLTIPFKLYIYFRSTHGVLKKWIQTISVVYCPESLRQSQSSYLCPGRVLKICSSLDCPRIALLFPKQCGQAPYKLQSRY